MKYLFSAFLVFFSLSVYGQCTFPVELLDGSALIVNSDNIGHATEQPFGTAFVYKNERYETATDINVLAAKCPDSFLKFTLSNGVLKFAPKADIVLVSPRGSGSTITLEQYQFNAVESYEQISAALKPLVDATIDAFGRKRISEARSLFDGQFTYDRQPLLFDTIRQANGAVVYDNKNKNIGLQVSGAGDFSGVQTFEYFRYQPGKSQLIFVTFNLWGGQAGVLKSVGYSDRTNGVEFSIINGVPYIRILSATDAGNDEVTQSNWNLDKMDGTGPSGIDLDFSKTQILVIDFQALYVGQVRVGFDVDGTVYYAHQFSHTNVEEYGYFQTANLPVTAYISSSGAADSLDLVCTSVMSEAGQDENYAYQFCTEGTGTAGNGTDVHILSIEPRDSFYLEQNRVKIQLGNVQVLNTGANDVIYTIYQGQAITSGTVAKVDSIYSAVDRITGGTLGASDPIAIGQGYSPEGPRNAGAATFQNVDIKTPISLRYDGTKRDYGRVSIVARGVGGTSAVRVIACWEEIR